MGVSDSDVQRKEVLLNSAWFRAECCPTNNVGIWAAVFDKEPEIKEQVSAY